jgi:pyruvate dehydrogenase E2 component (dihydrolipoamide acetyltransferase)
MSERVTMPALGESVTEGTVTRWLKSVGDTVDVDEALLEVSTDKVDTEIPSPISGTLQEILVAEDDTVPVGADLAVIGEGAGQSSAAPASGSADSADSAGPESAGSDADGAAQPSPPPAETPSTAIEPDQEAKAPKAQTHPADGDGTGDSGTTIAMPALGESVTEGTVTRWLKAEGDQVEVDEALLEVSTDKVDTEIPSPVAGTLTKILVAEDDTVPVGADLAVVGGSAATAPPPAQPSSADTSEAAPSAASASSAADSEDTDAEDTDAGDTDAGDTDAEDTDAEDTGPDDAAPAAESEPAEPTEDPPSYAAEPAPLPPQSPPPAAPPSASAPSQPDQPEQPEPAAPPAAGGASNSGASNGGDASAYVTPLVRKLATQHGVELSSLAGTGVGGRIRKQDVLDAAQSAREAADRSAAQEASSPAKSPATAATAAPAQAGGADSPTAAAPSFPVSPKRGTTEKMSRLRKLIAQRMVESLQVSAQLTTVVEVDVTRISRLRDRAKRDFETREGVKLSFLPFFALAAVEGLKQHPSLNASVEGDQITYHGAEHLGVAVDTERGLLVPVIKDAGDLNIAGLSRKIADLAERTRGNKVTPDELAGGTFTLTNTGSRGALFDTPIINQPQVAILGTGTVVKRPVVVPDRDGGEMIAIRSMVYLALSYDHRIVDGADAARFLGTMKARLEEGSFEASLGL